MHTFAALNLFSALVLSSSVLAVPNHGLSKLNIHARHAAAAVQEREALVVNLTERNVTLSKRADFDNARFTKFASGVGNCGSSFTDNDFVVAINTPQWDNGAHCYKTVTVNYQGKSAQAQIADRCVECPYGALDFTFGLLAYLAGNNDEVYGSWSWGSGEEPTPSTASTPPPPTSTPPPPPPKTSTTSMPKPETTTSTSTPSTKTSSAQPTTSTTSTKTTPSVVSTSTSTRVTSSAPLSLSSSTSSAAQTSASATVTTTAGSFLAGLNQACLQLGNLAAAHATG